MRLAVLVSALAAGASLAVWRAPRWSARDRLRRLGEARVDRAMNGAGAGAGGRGGPPGGTATAAVLVAAGLTVVVLVLGAGGPGPLVGSAAAIAVWSAVLRRRDGPVRRERDAVAHSLPRAADLLAACLHAGASPVQALDLVGPLLGSPIESRLRSVAGSLRHGSDPSQAWAAAGPEDPLAPLARAVLRASRTGAPLAETVALVADEQRRRMRASADEAARRAGVRAVGPLAVCFLPAFVLVGVVPVVLAMARDLATGLQ